MIRTLSRIFLAVGILCLLGYAFLGMGSSDGNQLVESYSKMICEAVGVQADSQPSTDSMPEGYVSPAEAVAGLLRVFADKMEHRSMPLLIAAITLSLSGLLVVAQDMNQPRAITSKKGSLRSETAGNGAAD